MKENKNAIFIDINRMTTNKKGTKMQRDFMDPIQQKSIKSV